MTLTVRDREGNVIGSSRLVCRYPYASELAPGQLTLPKGTQIPSGKSREQRVPLPIESGTVECSLFFKLYRPLATRWRMYDNAGGARRLVASGSHDQTAVVSDQRIWERLKKEYTE